MNVAMPGLSQKLSITHEKAPKERLKDVKINQMPSQVCVSLNAMIVAYITLDVLV
jgi:hypothetical protein